MIFLLLLQGDWIDMAAQGGRVAVAGQGAVTVYGKETATGVNQIVGVAFAPDGTLVVFGGRPARSGEVELVGKWKIDDHKDLVNAVAFGPDWMASASQDKTVVIRDMAGKPLRTLEGHTAAVLALAVSPDGKRLVSSGVDRTIRVWDPSNGRLLRTISNHGDRVGALAFSPDGAYLASGSRDRTVRIWQPEIGRLVRIVRGHDGEVLDLAWSDVLVSGCSDGKVRILDTAGDAILKEFDAGGWVNAVAVTPGEILAVSSKLHRWAR